MDITELIGKRVLLKLKTRSYRSEDVEEYKILEVSPSGNWVRIQNSNAYKFWKPVVELSLVEVLKPLRPAKPEEGQSE